MQAQLNEEMITARKLREDHNAIQMQRKQMEMHMASIGEQQQEAETTFQSQLNQVRVELQEQQSLNAQLNMELHSIREKIHTEKEILQERIRHTENQAHHFKAELDQKQDVVRQLEVNNLICLSHNVRTPPICISRKAVVHFLFIYCSYVLGISSQMQ